MEVIPVLSQANLPRLQNASSQYLTGVAGVSANPNPQDQNFFNQQVRGATPAVEQQPNTYVEAAFKQVTDLAEGYQQGLVQINDKLQHAQKTLDTATMLGIQLDVYKLVLQQDFFAKVASKGSSIFESLMRNQ